jgi:ATP-dependent DNA helicase RecG
VRLVLPMVSLIPAEVEAELRERFGEPFARLDETGVQAVVTARVEGSVTNGRLQEITGAHPKDITSVLQSLVREGFLEQQRQRRWASYRLAGDSPQSSPHNSTQDSPQTATDSPQTTASRLVSDDDSPRSTGELPPELATLAPLAAPARARKRLPADQMRDLIESLCRERWLSAAEIGLLLARDAAKVQSRFLTAMVREGRLELRYPEVPNRPDQAYRTRAAA